MKKIILLLLLFQSNSFAALINTNATEETVALYNQLNNTNKPFWGQYKFYTLRTTTDYVTESYKLTGKLPYYLESQYYNYTATEVKFLKLHYRSGGFIGLSSHQRNPYNGNNEYNRWGPLVNLTFSGSGLNDMTIGENYLGKDRGYFSVVISSTGTPDSFQWSINGGDYSEEIAITGEEQSLGGGVGYITFENTTGHTLNDEWLFEGESPTTAILPNGSLRVSYLAYLDDLALFLKETLVDDDSNPIPVLLRFWHENDGDFFWWGTFTTSGNKFKELWQDFVTYLTVTKSVNNVIFVYSPQLRETFSDYYPGDDYVDIIGADRYIETGTIDDISTVYSTLSTEASNRGKLFALTEGFRNLYDNPTADFWDEVVIDEIKEIVPLSQISYILTWSNNAVPGNQYGPGIGTLDSDSFVDLYESGDIIMLNPSNINLNGLNISGIKFGN
jgi:hypothetical protein